VLDTGVIALTKRLASLVRDDDDDPTAVFRGTRPGDQATAFEAPEAGGHRGRGDPLVAGERAWGRGTCAFKTVKDRKFEETWSRIRLDVEPSEASRDPPQCESQIGSELRWRR